MSQGRVIPLITATCTGISLGLVCFLLYRYSKRTDSKRETNSKSDRNKTQTEPETEAAICTEGGRQNHNNQKPSRNDEKAAGVQATASFQATFQAPSKAKPNANGHAHQDHGSDLASSDGFTTIKLSVPKDMVGPIIGRQGCSIKQIQSETKTKIDFGKQNSEGPERTVTIRGSEKGTQDAELRILHIVYGQPKKQTSKVKVPKASLGYIIGRAGVNIQRIQSDSQCQVKVDSDGDRSDPDAMAEVALTGTDEVIASALVMINECVEEWEAKRNKSKFVKEHSRPRHAISRKSRSAAVFPGSPLSCEQWPTHSDYIECYVTATSDPTHIWVQLLTPGAHKLEEINTQLTNLYSDHREFTDDLVSIPPPLGTILAARNPIDNKWYRGRLAAYSTDLEEKAVDVYFVDYGDSCWMPFENYNVQLLRPEFYHLYAQAVECYTELLLNPECPSEWLDDQIDFFEKLSHSGSWNVLMGSLVRRGSKPGAEAKDELPIIKLVDTNTEQDIDICAEVMKTVNPANLNMNNADENPASLNMNNADGKTANSDISNLDNSTAPSSVNTPLTSSSGQVLERVEVNVTVNGNHDVNDGASTVLDVVNTGSADVNDGTSTVLDVVNVGSTVTAGMPAGFDSGSDEEAWD